MRLVCAQAVEITTLSASDVISFLILFAKVIICQQSAKKYSCLFVKFLRPCGSKRAELERVFVITSVFVNKKKPTVITTIDFKNKLLKN